MSFFFMTCLSSSYGYIERCASLGTASDDALAFAKNMDRELP
jgi:hypothetical protein